jgi:hypothetical protein
MLYGELSAAEGANRFQSPLEWPLPFVVAALNLAPTWCDTPFDTNCLPITGWASSTYA